MNRLATQESYNKHLFRPNTYLHKWWARRSGTTFRYILKSLCTNETKMDYYASGGLEGTTILDPMMGGGTILHEAIRLGANVIGFDIDPIPVLQARASLSDIPLVEKKMAFHSFFDALSQRLSPFFETTCPICYQKCPIQFVFYGLRKRARNREFILVDSLQLRENTSGSPLYLCPRTGGIVEFDPVHNSAVETQAISAENTIYEKGHPYVREKRDSLEELTELPYWKRYTPLVVVGLSLIHISEPTRPY